MTVIATPSTTSNSYASNAYAVQVWQADPHKTDYPATTSAQDLALKSATSILNDTYQQKFLGTITNAVNALYFPRDGVMNPRTGVYFETAAYPDILSKATAVFAYYINKTNRNTETQVQGQGPVVEKSLEGVGTFKYAAPSVVKVQEIYTIPEEVLKILSPLISGGSSNGFGVSVMGRG